MTVSTLGLLLPRQTFYLEKYKTDRTWYGDAKFVQGGKWTGLYGAMLHMFIGSGLTVAPLIFLGVQAARAGTSEAMPPIALAALPVVFIGMVWGSIGYVHYRVHSFRYLTANRFLMRQVGFLSAPRTGSLIGVCLLGSLMFGLVFTGVMIVAGAVAGG